MGIRTRTGLFLWSSMRVGLDSEDCGIISISFLFSFSWPWCTKNSRAVCRYFFVILERVTVDYETRHRRALVNTQLAWRSWKCWEICLHKQIWDLLIQTILAADTRYFSVLFSFSWMKNFSLCSQSAVTHLHSTTEGAWSGWCKNGYILVLRPFEFTCHKHLQLLFSPIPENLLFFCPQIFLLLGAALLWRFIFLWLWTSSKLHLLLTTQVFSCFNFQTETFDCLFFYYIYYNSVDK